jgi:hypothetical protein
VLIDDLDIRVLHRDTGQLIRDAVFQQKRPGQFNGVQLVGGTHSDGYRSSAVFGLAQFVVALATGPSSAENVEAVQVLAQGWITDMYANRVYDPATRTGIYGVPGEPGETVIDIPTDAGLARGYVLPAPRSQFTTLLLLLFGAVFELPTAFDLDQCAEDPSAAAATATSPSRRPRRKPRINGKLHTKHGVIS